MNTEATRMAYQSRLIYETVLSDILKRCLKERIDDPDTKYPRCVQAFRMAMPLNIKKDYIRWLKEKKQQGTILKEHDAILEYLLERMEKNNLLIPQKAIPRGGGYR